MKKPDQVTRGLLILLAVLVPLLVLALVGRDFILNAVVIPVEYFFWLGNLALRAMPQYIFWAILCAMAVLVAVFSLISGGKDELPNVKRPPERTTRERVAFWTLQVRMAKNGDYSRLRFADFYSKLILDILSYSGRINLDEYVESMQNGDLDLPQPVLTFLKARLTPIYAQGPGSLKERWTLRWLRVKDVFRRKRKDASGDAFDRQVSQVIEYLENELEGDKKNDGH